MGQNEKQFIINQSELLEGIAFDSKFYYEDFTESETNNRGYLNDVGLPEGF
ncbi:hypothetical protein [Paracholeplasma brassicae]|jgi:hypothetical protein|nr:hypothetical protein [Paracholeplasma brassicae]